MARSHFLSFYVILILLPLLGCRLIDKALLEKSTLTKLDHIHGEDPDDFLLIEPFTDLQVGQQKQYRENSKSMFDITRLKGTFTSIFKTQTQTKAPESKALISWKVCYGIAQKASGPSNSLEVQNMATAVRAIGPRFDLYQNTARVKIQDVKYAINLHALSLQSDSLNTAERIWSVGVLEYLRSQLSEGYRNSLHAPIPDVWTAKDLSRPRGQFLLFFLQDKDLGKAAQEMWSEFPPKLETSEYVTQEAIQRESIVHLIQEQIRTATDRPSAEFQTIHLAFINLETPIDSGKASSLMELIINHLNRPNIPKRDGFDEQATTVRLLLHLEEYHYESYVRFRVATDSRDIQEKILASDISFQLAERLPPGVRSLLTEFQNTIPINGPQIIKVLESLKHEQISSPQLGRYFRALNFVVNRNRAIYTYFHYQLKNYPEIMPKLFEMLIQRRYGQMDPELFSKDSSEYLIYSENEDRVAMKYRDALAEVLVSKQVLSERDTTERSQNLAGASKQSILTSMLYAIFKKVSESKAFEHNDPETEALLVEYILHLISFKIGDRTLYRRLIAYKQNTEKRPAYQTLAFEMLRQEIFQFVNKRAWNYARQPEDFTQDLRGLEDQILYKGYMLKDDYLSDWTEVATGRTGEVLHNFKFQESNIPVNQCFQSPRVL
ncbi:uncharacterized protein MELLADRAFT_105670 [Melampsora larici-populina 98AG31]|uniref:Secreted protein n=1 Tax=Melampsora larici-populina (strain 98AG31 / pathotype 3-4-7) TaxID=747676 RepID=F4RIZ5_MELLP|nr:uncharacterized protein MELLADRAFT_105670 [Melampsora larici-populina 98AG31]EGG07744.1 hypothetical protein MELLADRAFT_105670 [Melampsora larici-populina 98AG31]